MFLYQPSSGYRCNSDSIFLYDFIRRFSPMGRVLDVGSGVGILGLLIARDFDVEMSIVDKQSYMIKYAKHNYSINHLSVHSFVSDFIDLAKPGFAEKYDLIVSNPPFYDSSVIQSENERLNIARYAHHLPLYKMIHSINKVLRPKGHFIFCYDAKQTDVVLYELKNTKLNPIEIRFVHSKSDRDAKIVLICARANSKSMLRVLPPLIVFGDNDEYLPEAQTTFDMADVNVITAD